ncbi:MAG: penicillin-binding protein activator [Alphaproteobacteria bacterium]|nr:penicillin-binding protein activator [Alphaproteobacteria bacterium]
MLYRILAIVALFFFTACGGTGGDPNVLKPANNTFPSTTPYEPGRAYPGSPAPQMPEGTEPGVVPLKVIKIGLLVPLSGQASAVGLALQDAATLALMDKYGYTQTDKLKVKIVLVPKDTQGTPAGAAAAAQAVLNSGAQLIVGPLFSQNVAAVAPIAKQNGVNVLTFSNNPSVAGDNVFVFGFQVDHQVRRILNYALNRSLTDIALISPNNAYGKSVKDSTLNLMQGSGLQLAAQQYYNPATNAASEIELLGKINADTPLDAVLVPEGGQKLEMMVNMMRQQGITQPNVRFLGTGLWDEPMILRSGTLVGGWFASSDPDRFGAYERRFRDFFGYAPPRISALAYDAVALAASLGMASHDTNFSEEALTDPVGYDGPVNGVFRCNLGGICERGLAVMEVTGKGTAKVIDPAPTAF